MSDTRTGQRGRPTMTMDDAVQMPMPTAEQDYGIGMAMVPTGQRSALDSAQASVVLAQRVPIKRDMTRILREIDDAAAVAAQRFYYRWETKNRDGSKGVVMGASIDCAMAVVNIWGNCAVDVFPAQESATHWVFAARFCDYEKGLTYVRTFQQRKNQTAGGRMDADRMRDIAFQIGQSKAVRNVIVGALKMYVDRAVQAASTSAYNWVHNNFERARDIVLTEAANLGVPLNIMERSVARSSDKWTVPDVIALRAKLTSIADHMDDITSAFGLEEEDGADADGVVAKPTTADSKPADQAADDKEPAKRPRATSTRTARTEPTKPQPETQQQPTTGQADTAPDTNLPQDGGDPGPTDPDAGRTDERPADVLKPEREQPAPQQTQQRPAAAARPVQQDAADELSFE